MRSIGTLHPTDGAPLPPDTVFTFAISAGTAQAQSWLSSASTVTANAAAAGVGIARITAMTSAGGAMTFVANLTSTAAASPTSSLSSGGSTNANVTSATAMTYQIPGASTGFSVCAATSGYIMVEQWKK